MPYLLSVMMDHGKIDPRKISCEERHIIDKYKVGDLLVGGGVETVWVPPDFWAAITRLVYLGYVDLSD